MIAKLKLVHGDVDSEPYYVYKKEFDWAASFRGMVLQPQVGMTVIIPARRQIRHGGAVGYAVESLRFYITHIIADLRDNGGIIIVERRMFGYTNKAMCNMEAFAKTLANYDWQREI